MLKKSLSVLGYEWKLARECFVHQYTKGVDITACVGGIAHTLLRAHVLGSSERIAVLGERFFLREFAHSKVEHLHSAALTEKDVPRLEIAMNNSEAMRGRQSAAGLHEDGDRDARRQGTLPFESLL